MDSCLHKEDGPATHWYFRPDMEDENEWYFHGTKCKDFEEWCKVSNKTESEITLLKLQLF